MSIGMRGFAFRNRTSLYALVPLFVLACGLLCFSPAASAQTGGVNQGGEPYIHQPAGMDPLPAHGTSEGEVQMARMRQAERQRRIAADTAKLVVLSQQLKAEMDATPKDQLSVDAMRKADEIEKVAHDLKGWMKDKD